MIVSTEGERDVPRRLSAQFRDWVGPRMGPSHSSILVGAYGAEGRRTSYASYMTQARDERHQQHPPAPTDTTRCRAATPPAHARDRRS